MLKICVTAHADDRSTLRVIFVSCCIAKHCKGPFCPLSPPPHHTNTKHRLIRAHMSTVCTQCLPLRPWRCSDACKLNCSNFYVGKFAQGSVSLQERHKVHKIKWRNRLWLVFTRWNCFIGREIFISWQDFCGSACLNMYSETEAM